MHTLFIIAQKKEGVNPPVSNFFCLWILIEPIWRSVLHDTLKTQKFYLDRVSQGHMLEDHNENWSSAYSHLLDRSKISP